MKRQIAKNLRSVFDQSQKYHPFPILNCMVNFGSCPVSEVRSMMKEFEKRMNGMFSERYLDCLVLGEYELAPTLIYGQSCVYTGEAQDSLGFKQSSELGL